MVFDLGCGPGNITQKIADRFLNARVYGIDNSTEMLERARAETTSNPASEQIQWVHGDISSLDVVELAGSAADIMYSNAALHWLDDHEHLFPHLVSNLRVGGVLAVQMPMSYDCASHRLLRSCLTDSAGTGSPRAESLLERMQQPPILDAERYYDLLSATCEVDLWETTYWQELTGEDPVLDWVRGTALRPVLEQLEGPELDEFLARYARKLREAYPVRANGTTLFRFPRLFLTARRR